jgi:hypothetical protein
MQKETKRIPRLVGMLGMGVDFVVRPTTNGILKPLSS